MLDWWLPENVSTYGAEIDWLFHLIYYITGATFVLVFVTMLVFIVIYRDRPGRTARYTHGNTPLEIAWTIVPALILVILTALSVPAWSRIKMQVPASDFDVNVTAKQFNWQVGYPGSDKVFLDEMHVPVNKVVRVHLRSQDVKLLRPAVPHETGRGAGPRDRPVVRGGQAGQVRVAVRGAVRVRPLRDARLDLRAHARGLRQVGGREP